MMGIHAPVQLIVEGPGDDGAVPVLLRKFLHEQGDYRNLLGSPISAKGLGNLTKENGIEGFLRVASGRKGTQLIVVVVDADKECIKERADMLRARCSTSVPVLIVIADKKFEDWIYASAESTLDVSFVAGKSGLGEIKAARKYTKSIDQAKLAAKMDFSIARGRNRSLDRFFERFEAVRPSLAVESDS